MKREQEMVREFHEKCDALISGVPAVPIYWGDRSLRLKLIQEELSELAEAFRDGDVVGTADALGDLLYVVLGTAVSCGIDIEPIFHAIHKSNMTKFIDGHRREDGKWVKGPSYTPANLEPILKQQSHAHKWEANEDSFGFDICRGCGLHRPSALSDEEKSRQYWESNTAG